MSNALFRNLNPEYITFRSGLSYRSQVGLCVVDAFKQRKYIRNQDNWDIFWVEKECLDNFYINHRVSRTQRVNHYRSFNEICKKDNLNRNIKKYKRALERQGRTRQAAEYNFVPVTYHLPIQYAVFQDEFKRLLAANKNNVWIMKPTSKSQGKGIFLFNKLSAIQQWSQNAEAELYICQKYIDNPLLIGHKKFDLRLYVLCTSYRPLQIYLYREGFARFTHYRYQNENITNTELHLTNVAIQKNTSEYNKNLGGKMSLSSLKLYLLSKYNGEERNRVNRCFSEITYLIIKTLKSVAKIMSNQSNCFQLYGFDIMLDSNLYPWLIEINGSPSMRANTKNDKELKIGLIDDLLTVIDLEGVRVGDQKNVGGFDLICQNGERVYPRYYVDAPGMHMLGCKLERQKNYIDLANELNNHYRKNRKIVPTVNNKIYHKIPSSNEECGSPVKKGFSVRKAKRGNSLVKQESGIKKDQPIQSESIQASINIHDLDVKLSSSITKPLVDNPSYRHTKLKKTSFPSQQSTPNQSFGNDLRPKSNLKPLPNNPSQNRIFVKKPVRPT